MKRKIFLAITAFLALLVPSIVLAAAPTAPTIGSPTALSTTSIRWAFTDNASTEKGFKVFDSSNVLRKTCASPNLSYCDELGLAVNTSYTRKVASYYEDGQADIAVANGTTSYMSYFNSLVNGTGTFGAKNNVVNTANGQPLTAGDFNNDNLIDLVTIYNDGASVFINTGGSGSSVFTSKSDYSVGTAPRGVAVGDANNDGWLDIAVANYTSNDFSILINNGNGTFASPANYSTGAGSTPNTIGFKDVNNDGWADIVEGNTGAGMNYFSVYLNSGSGTYSSGTNYAAPAAVYSLDINDVNNDGWNDVVAGSDSYVSVYINNGNGTFATGVDHGSGAGLMRDLNIGDLNNDGWLDIATINFAGTSLMIYMNNGNGTFAAYQLYGTVAIPRGVSIGDLNGDGWADVAVANFIVATPATISVFINNGNGTFATGVNYSVSSKPIDVVIANFSGTENSSYTSTATAYTLANAPGTPTVGSPTASTLNVTVAINSNPAATEFAIQETGSTNYVNKTTGALQGSASWGTYAEWGSGSGITVTGLSGSTLYTFKVKARNGDNVETAFSSTAADTTSSSTPTAPTIGTPSILSSTSIRWTFTDNASNETGFKVYDGSNVLKVTCATADLAYCDETGLDINTTYTRKVVAYNGQGNSSYSSTATAYTLANAPGTPTVGSLTTSTLNVTVAINSNPAATEFAIQETGSTNYVNKTTGALQASASWGTYAEFGSGSGITVTGLSEGTSYTFKVKARNGDNVETAFSSTAAAYTLVSAPTIGTPTILSATSIRWTFTDNATNETGFKVYDGSNTLKVTCATANLSYCDETGLSVNTTYTRKVVAYNAAGNSSYSSTAAAYTLANVPGTPTVGSPTSSSLLVTINVNGNSANTEFAIQDVESGNYVDKSTGERAVGGVESWGTYAEFGSGSGITVTGLFDESLYTFKVKARNGDNVETAFSSTAAEWTSAIVPATPTTPTIGTPSILSTTSIRWTFTDNASDEVGFKVYDDSNTLKVTCATVDLAYCDETGLSVNTTYTRKVVAYNAEGDSAYTSTATAYTLANVPGTPTATVASGTTTVVTINVNSNPANTEFAIQDVGSGNYINKATGARILGATPSWGTYAEFGSGSGITVTGLTEGNLYVFKVKARNGDNVATAFSSTSSARTKSIVLAASLPASVSTVVLATDGVTDLTSTDNAQTGTQTVQLQSTGSVPVVDFAFDFDSGNLDLTGVVVDSDAALKEAVVTGVTPTHTLYIPKGETDNQVTICPSATTLEEVYEGCAGAILAYDGYSADGITVSISGSYWKVDGLTGTGGFSSSSVESVNVQARQKISTLSTHNFGFNMSSGTNFAAGDTMIITFQDDGGGAWTFPADGDWVTGDFTFNDGTARTILAVGASPSCSSGANNVTVTTSQSGKSLTVTACTGYTASGTGAPVALNVVTARITNPEVAGSYEIWLTGSYGDLQSEFEVPILTDDQVSLTASVDTYINFNVTTSYGTDNALSLGEISFGSIASSNDSNRPDGSGGTLPVDNISLSLDTNATGGTLVQVMSASGGLASTVANYTLTSASETLAINQNSVSDTAGYGLQAQSVTPTRGTLTKQSPFAGSSNTVGAVSGTFATIYSSPADIGVVGASANVYVLAVPAKNTPAADDYIDTLTFRATGTF